MRASPRIRSMAAAVLLAASPAAEACNVSASPLSFGAIDPLEQRDTDSTGTITVTCPALTPYSISINTGSGSFSERRMTDGSNTLRYQVYTDASRSVIWGDGTGGSTVLAGEAGTSGT